MLKSFNTRSAKSSISAKSSESGTLRVIGDRASGKSTYMAALARWPNADSFSPVETVNPFNEDGKALIAKAQNLLEQGLQLEPTQLINPDIPDYGIRIILKGQFSWRNPQITGDSQPVPLVINCKDYAGEFFSDLLYKSGDPLLMDYLQDCVLASGVLLLLDGTAHRKDQEYADSMERFLASLDQTDINNRKRRIALAIAKCEQPELWVQRFSPQDMAQARFPRVCRTLQAWQKIGAGNVEYFATSAFGMLGKNYPEPNSILVKRDRGGVTAVLKDPKRWRPFGLVSPLYWLCTGERHKQLDKD